LKKINKIVKHFENLAKRRREKIQITTLKTKKGAIASNANEIQSITRKYSENLYYKTEPR
jgi:hypothetical protein